MAPVEDRHVAVFVLVHLHLRRPEPVSSTTSVIERPWRSLKYEAAYLYELRDEVEAGRVIGSWIDFQNEVRPHSALAGRTPGDTNREGAEVM